MESASELSIKMKAEWEKLKKEAKQTKTAALISKMKVNTGKYKDVSYLIDDDSRLGSSHPDLYEASWHQSRYRQQQQKTAELKQELQEIKNDLKFLKQKSAAQDSQGRCLEMIRDTFVLVGDLKSDIRKLNTEPQVEETSEEKWKTSYDILLREHNDLKASHQAQIVALNKQLESEMTKSLNAEMRLVDMGKMATLHKIDLKKMEAESYYKMLGNAMKQITPVMSIPNDVLEKYEELFSYIRSCKHLKDRVQSTALRLKSNLISDLSIELSDMELSLPPVPVPKSQA